MTEIGANPNEAVNAGRQAETYASTFGGLIKAFQDAVHDARMAAAEPPCQRGYDPYGESNVAAMAKLQELSQTLGGNVAAGGAMAGQNDTETAAGFNATAGALRIDINY